MILKVLVAENEFIDKDEILLGAPQGRREVGLCFRHRVLDSLHSAWAAYFTRLNVVVVKILQSQPYKLFAEFGIPQLLAVPGSQFLEVKVLDDPLKIQNDKNL